MSAQRMHLTVDSIAAGGDGVARSAGLVVFVPRSAPGDVIEADATVKGRFARAEIVHIEQAGPSRVEPPCAHYTGDRCGGCQLQHLAYEAQLAAKSGITRDSLVRLGKRQVEPPAVFASDRVWRYRRKLTLALRFIDGRWVGGLHRYDDPSRIFALRDCPITDERVVALWRDVLRAGRHLPRGRALRGSVRLLDGGAALVLEGGESWPGADALFAQVSGLTSLWWKPEAGRLRRIRARNDGDADGGLLGASFVQVNPEVAGILQAAVVDRVRAYAPRAMIDGYAGRGDTALALAAMGVQVTAIELDAAAAAWSAERLPPGSRSIAARVEDALPAALPADVIVLNPPRAGLDATVTSILEAQRPAPRAIIYVSCNPATLARDLVRLPRFSIASLRCFDMFPQTAHVETLCELIPEAA